MRLALLYQWVVCPISPDWTEFALTASETCLLIFPECQLEKKWCGAMNLIRTWLMYKEQIHYLILLLIFIVPLFIIIIIMHMVQMTSQRYNYLKRTFNIGCGVMVGLRRAEIRCQHKQLMVGKRSVYSQNQKWRTKDTRSRCRFHLEKQEQVAKRQLSQTSWGWLGGCTRFLHIEKHHHTKSKLQKVKAKT